MSGIKTEMMRIDDLRNIATVIAEQAGAISECDGHYGTYLTNSDVDAEKTAYAIGTNMHKKGDMNCSREELMDAIHVVMAEAGWECPSCEKNRID